MKSIYDKVMACIDAEDSNEIIELIEKTDSDFDELDTDIEDIKYDLKMLILSFKEVKITELESHIESKLDSVIERLQEVREKLY